MGSTRFSCEERGTNPAVAFSRAIDRARDIREARQPEVPSEREWFVTSILQKSNFLFFRIPQGVSWEEYRESLDWHHPWLEKWNDTAGCTVLEEVRDGNSLFLFIGTTD